MIWSDGFSARLCHPSNLAPNNAKATKSDSFGGNRTRLLQGVVNKVASCRGFDYTARRCDDRQL